MADYVRGERLEALRKAAHLSQEDAAHKLQVTAKTFRAWEKGGAIRWPNAKKIGDLFGIDPETLIYREEGAGIPPVPVADDQLDRIERRLEEAITEVRAAVATLAADNLRLTQALEDLRGTGRRRPPKADGGR